MPTINTRPPSNAQVGKATLDRVAAGGSFGRPVTMTGPQLTAFGKNLQKLAKTNPERAAVLLQRTMDLYGEGKIKVKSEGPVSYSGRNEMARMTNDVIAAINRADPSVATPAPMFMAR